MIIGEALRRLFAGMTITVDNVVKNVRYDHGNQDELDKFIRESDKQNVTKYPLVFYVTDKVKIEPSQWRLVNTKLIIMMGTREPYLSQFRTEESYVKHIEPIYTECRQRINQNGFISLLGEKEDKFAYIDRPNYGITEGKVGSEKQKKSVVTDYVDARIIDLNIRIKPNCIN